MNTCECGDKYKPSYYCNHLQSNRHKNFLNGIKNICYEILPDGKLKCECHSVIKARSGLKTHEKTEHHNKYMETPIGEEFTYYLNINGLSCFKHNIYGVNAKKITVLRK